MTENKVYLFNHYYRGYTQISSTVNNIIKLQEANINNLNDKIFNLYEIIYSNNPVIMYFDFDYDVKIEDKHIIIDNEFLITDKIIVAIKKTLKYYNLINDDENDNYKLYASLSTGIKNNDEKFYKYSLHVLIRGIGYLERNEYIKKHIISKLNKYLYRSIKINDEYIDIKADTEVYKGDVKGKPGQQKFRTLNSYKETWISKLDENGKQVFNITKENKKYPDFKRQITKHKRFSRDITLDHEDNKIIYNKCNRFLFEKHLITNINNETNIIDIEKIIEINNKKLDEENKHKRLSDLLIQYENSNFEDEPENIECKNFIFNKEDYENDIDLILKNLNISRADNYNEWFKICCILVNHYQGNEKGYHIFDEFSKRSDKYNYEDVKYFYYNCKIKNTDGLTLKTLYYMLKKDNIKVFNELIISNNNDEMKVCGLDNEVYEGMTLIMNSMKETDKNINDEFYLKNLTKKVCNFDSTDEFCWGDFIFYLQSTVFKDKKQMNKYIIENLPRVFIRIISGKDKIIYKSNCEDNLYNVENYTFNWSDQIVKYKNDDNKYETIKLVKLVNELSMYLPLIKKIVCESDISQVKNNTFNIYEKYIAEKVIYEVEELKQFLDFIKLVWCNNEEDLYSYFMKWLAFIIQNPNEKSGIAVVGLSKDGCGKNTVSNFLAEFVFGLKKSLPNLNGIDKLVGEKNLHLVNKRFVVCNEMASTREEFRCNFDKLKSIITDKILNVRPLYQEPYDVKQYIELMLFSNNFDSIILSQTDRRYFILKINEIYINNKIYFSNLHRIIMNQDFGNKFYSYMMDFDCNDFKLLHIPITETKQNIINISLPSPLKFFDYLKEQILFDRNEREDIIRNKFPEDNITEKEDNKLEVKIRVSIMYDMYKLYCSDKKEYPFSNVKFAESITPSLCDKKKYKDATYYIFTLDKN
jgi:hypothetical protein